MTVSFTDILTMLTSRQPLPDACNNACGLIFNELQESGTMLSSEWQHIIRRSAQLQNKPWPQFKHPRVAIYASNYGADLENTQKRLEKLAQQQDPLTRLCALLDADLRVYELDLTQEISAAISEEEAAHALSYGLMAVEEHVDCLIVDCLATGAETVLAQWEKLLQQDTQTDALHLLLQAKAGHDVFALLGAVFAARMAGIPVFCGAKIAAVLTLALSRILANDGDFLFVLPTEIQAKDIVQTMAGVQQLKLILALGPAPKKQLTDLKTKAA